MEKKTLRTNARLEENILLQNSYRELIKKILLACELVDEEVLETVGDSFELLCEVRPAEAREKTDTGIVEVPIDDFKIVVFVVYAIEIGSTTFSTVRSLVEQDDVLVGGCDANWERRSQESPQWGTLTISLPGQREFSFRFFTDDNTMSDVVKVGDYYETYQSVSLRGKSMKERLEYLQNLSSKLGLT